MRNPFGNVTRKAARRSTRLGTVRRVTQGYAGQSMDSEVWNRS